MGTIQQEDRTDEWFTVINTAESQIRETAILLLTKMITRLHMSLGLAVFGNGHCGATGGSWCGTTPETSW
jgi:hypothetical protein